MGKFVVLYTEGTYPENDEEREAVMAAWGAWYEKMGEAITDGGNPFSQSKHVSQSGVGDGAFSSPPATGYTIIAANSLDDAVSKVVDHPHVGFGGQVTVCETIDM